MKVDGAWLHHVGTQTLCRALEAKGYQALFVGGCVRNALLGAPVNDIDIATDALPETATNIAESQGFNVIPTGIDHGTVTVIAKGLPHEVTTFRQDIETNGRHATVRFSTDVAMDAARRDFTMNALYARIDGTVVDPLGGLPDLQARRVRFVGDATLRITEDYLRILRFFRFFAWYGDPALGLDAEGLAACAANSAGIETLSRERVGAELCKLLSAPDPSLAVASMAQSGVLAAALPGADARALPIAVHFGLGSWQGRLAVLGGAVETLRLSRSDLAQITLIRNEVGNMRSPAELGYRFGADVAAAVTLSRAAMFETPPPEGWQAQVQLGAQARLPVSAADLMPEFQGAALGAQLHMLEDRWIASGFTLSKTDLLG
ncbi:CCA tRNA nucleotidyltransferase [Pseudorhodobacter turbinis]|uniref:CCA tRNA nucleotidyltransferase n=1 Tax=Pseudorhodobacter turbinis TaxID=2500533 RepID=A0A4P8EG68_9RHOB|nr:CCA tRNA nucleotidyltransferase [Pseudorhodobacter turbinis]QCO55827.1 CCA tRNA nucleotidyltransferase [Pseudorhodobacter turbinis]